MRSGRPPRPSRAAKAPPNGTGHARRAGGIVPISRLNLDEYNLLTVHS
ncbi:hypothetical protein [Bordetella pertussis]|nr:hypothetical protein [Bordetella pertussis]